MITVCPGWETRHRVPVLLDDDGTNNGEISHGMCGICHAAAVRALDEQEAAERRQEITERVNRYVRAMR